MNRKPHNYYAILAFYRWYEKQFKRPPTFREVMDGTGITSTSVVRFHIEKAVKDGDLVMLGEEGEARNYKVSENYKSEKSIGGKNERLIETT